MRGFGLLEIIIAVAIMAGSLYALATVFLLAERTVELSRERLQAVFLLEEGVEVLRFLRDSGWGGNIGNLNADTDYYLNFDPAASTWSIQTSAPPALDGIFTRSFRVESVLRDAGDNIASSGTNDPETKKIIMRLTWSFRAVTETQTIETYLMDIFNN